MKKLTYVALGIAGTAMIAAAPAMAAGDAAKGEKIFKKCHICHTIEKGGPNKTGPNLFGIVGRKSGIEDGYHYSKAMEEKDIVWTKENLDVYLKKPRAFVKGTRMSFPGLKKESDRQDLIAYLDTFH
ncbi:MAG: cytochrome c family protein [Alphaproteobacteria bacterium]|nr:MAG: cytochrome c family protein [Alphaproteobacteria bacterium]